MTDYTATRMWTLPRPLLWASVLALMAVFPFFFIGSGGGGTGGGSGRALWPAIWNLGHGAYFGLFTLVWLHTWRRPIMRRAWVVTLLVLAVGVMIEAAQGLTGRNPSMHDVWRNLLGAWAVLVFWPGAWPMQRWRWPIRLTVTVLVALELAYWLEPVLDDVRLDRQVPVLFDQSSLESLENWRGQVEWYDMADQPHPVLQANLGTGRYSGFRLHRLPKDWEGYDTLTFELYNPVDDPLGLTLRINDRVHNAQGYAYTNRFNTRLTVNHGWNHYRVPLADIAAAPESRRMDLDQIDQMQWFASALDQPQSVYLNALRLE